MHCVKIVQALFGLFWQCRMLAICHGCRRSEGGKGGKRHPLDLAFDVGNDLITHQLFRHQKWCDDSSISVSEEVQLTDKFCFFFVNN